MYLYRFSVLNPGDTIGVKGYASMLGGSSGWSSARSSGGILPYYHVGIYIGHKQVIDYMNDSKVRRIHLMDFTEGDRRHLCRIRYVKAPPADGPRAIVERAVHLWNGNEEFGKYDLITNNCEHFVTYCTFGKGLSMRTV